VAGHSFEVLSLLLLQEIDEILHADRHDAVYLVLQAVDDPLLGVLVPLLALADGLDGARSPVHAAADLNHAGSHSTHGHGSAADHAHGEALREALCGPGAAPLFVAIHSPLNRRCK
jgi:hypothetical protein